MKSCLLVFSFPWLSIWSVPFHWLFLRFSLSVVINQCGYSVASWFIFSGIWAWSSFLGLYIYSFHHIFKIFGHYFFEYIYFPLLSPPPFSGDSSFMNIRSLIPWLTDFPSFSFSSSPLLPLLLFYPSSPSFFFSLCFILDSFYCYSWSSLIFFSAGPNLPLISSIS